MLVEEAGYYRECKHYKYNGADYAKASRGFVKLQPKVHKDNTFGSTSHTKVRWTDIITTEKF